MKPTMASPPPSNTIPHASRQVALLKRRMMCTQAVTHDPQKRVALSHSLAGSRTPVSVSLILCCCMHVHVCMIACKDQGQDLPESSTSPAGRPPFTAPRALQTHCKRMSLCPRQGARQDNSRGFAPRNGLDPGVRRVRSAFAGGVRAENLVMN